MAEKTNYVKKGKNGREYKYYRLSKRLPTGEDKEFTGKNKKEATAKKDEYMEGLHLGLKADYNEMTLEKFMRVWLFDVMRMELADSSFDRYEGIYRNYIKETSFAKLKVYEIDRLTLQRNYNLMFESGKTTAKIRNLNKLLKTFFNFAIAEGYIVKNPCFKIIIPKNKEALDEDEDVFDVDPFSEDELKLISEHVRPEMKMLFQLDLGTGMRLGEMLALTERDFDFHNAEVKINKTLKTVKVIKEDGSYEYKTVVKPPKSKSSNRIIPIPSSLLAPLQRHIISEKEKYLKKGQPYTKSSLIFTTESCNYIDCKNLLRAWQRTLKRAGVRYRKLHCIRHTYATKLFEADVPLITISKLLGHHDIEITARIYVHVMPKEKDNAAQKLNYLFNV